MQADQNKSADRVLIVEDEENARRGYESLLQKWGLDVMGVPSAEDALARFEEGIALSQQLQQQLTEAQRRVEVLKQGLGGEYRAEPLDGDGA